MGVVTALKEIRDSRLYREQYATFEAYCKERWGFARNYANKLIQSAEVTGELNGYNCTQIPATESQARELARIPEERRAEVWQKVTETHEPVDITAKVIRILLASVRGEA